MTINKTNKDMVYVSADMKNILEEVKDKKGTMAEVIKLLKEQEQNSFRLAIMNYLPIDNNLLGNKILFHFRMSENDKIFINKLSKDTGIDKSIMYRYALQIYFNKQKGVGYHE